MSKEQQMERIAALKKKRNAIILSHYYQPDDVQSVADLTGDSFALSQAAASTNASVILFCGVHFMAETASLLSPEKIVLLPDANAGCPLADTITPNSLRNMKSAYPEAAVVSYVNTSATIKAESDICCTSSNAVAVVNSQPQKQVLFIPDRNLAAYVAGKTSKEIIPWPGCCPIHDGVSPTHVKEMRSNYPNAPIAVHPECPPDVLMLADYVGSTAGILAYAKNHFSKQIIIGTEIGLAYALKKENPEKKFIFLSESLYCPTMKLTTLDKMISSLENMAPRVEVPNAIREAAKDAVDKMVTIKSAVESKS